MTTAPGNTYQVANASKRKVDRAFIGCSLEGMSVAGAIQKNLDRWCFPEIWDQGLFTPSYTTIESLERKLPQFACAVFLLTPDDIKVMRNTTVPAPRDNLVLEVGMAIGILGRDRTFLVVPENSQIGLPTDLIGVTYVNYDPEGPNPEASLAPSCSRIREAFEASLIRSSNPLISWGKAIADIHATHMGEVRSLLSFAGETMFASGVFRRNWTIDFSYDFSEIGTNIIIEKILWEYEFVNVRSKAISYPLRLFCASEDTDTLVSFTRIDPAGKRQPVFTSGKSTLVSTGLWRKRQEEVVLDPAVSYYMDMRFQQKQPVDPQTHYIHNSLCPLDLTLAVRLRFRLPPGYRVDLWAMGAVVEPTILDENWDFRIQGWLLPYQMIEYMVRKE